MKTLVYTQINSDYAASMNSSLQNFLADIQVLYSNIRGFHWNVSGKNFYELHSKFEKVYDDLSEKADEIAERILQLGGVPESKYSEYIKKSQFKEVNSIISGSEMIVYLLEAYKTLISSERAILAKASKAGDDVTVAIITDYIKEQEKEIWMLSAYSL